MRAATATADPPLEPPGVRVSVPRILRRPERGILGGRAHRELVEVGLADDRRRPPVRAACTTVALYGGTKPCENFRRSGRRHARGAEVVFERDRHAVQRSEHCARRLCVVEHARAMSSACSAINGVERGSAARAVLDAIERGSARLAAVSSPAAICAASADAVRSAGSSDHARHFEEPGFDRRIRRVGEQLFATASSAARRRDRPADSDTARSAATPVVSSARSARRKSRMSASCRVNSSISSSVSSRRARSAIALDFLRGKNDDDA